MKSKIIISDNQISQDKGFVDAYPFNHALWPGYFNLNKMKYIPLTQGQNAIVDDEDFEYLNQWKWFIFNSRGILYVMRREYHKRINGKQKYQNIFMHRLLMNPPKNMVIDHLNRNSLDNRKVNLRICTHRENLQNTKKTNKYGYLGIDKRHNRYAAIIGLNNKKIYVGSYETKLEAYNAYINKSNELNKLAK
jgi:hypothetical protein